MAGHGWPWLAIAAMAGHGQPSRLTQCRFGDVPMSLQGRPTGRFIFESVSIFCAALDCIDQILVLFIVVSSICDVERSLAIFISTLYS